uniref:Uncharacterized protein n=1 Tax=Neobodo designis TaxID=312471 RepID=A0A7S1QUQ7_NEODS
MGAIRRARKSLPERRLNGLQRELDSNFEKVELRAHLKGKQERAAERRRRGLDVPELPASVRRGEIDDELFGIECRLHREAGLPPPKREFAERQSVRRLGLVPFHRLVSQAVEMFKRTNGSKR